jgi:hypothetical protein
MVGSRTRRDGTARDVALTGSSRHANPNHALAPERLAYLARRIHALGPRPLFELFVELEAGEPLLPRLEAYARLAPLGGFIAEMGGDRLPRPRLIARRRA